MARRPSVRADLCSPAPGFQAATQPSQSGISCGATKMLEIIVSGNATANRPPAASGLGTRRPSHTPIQISANRSHSSSPNAARNPQPPSGRQPMASAVSIMMASSAQATTRSVTPRPATTADDAIGMERKRSMTPFVESWTTTVAVLMKPKAMVITNMPGIRKSL